MQRASIIIVSVIVLLMLTSYLFVREIHVSNKWTTINDWGYQLQDFDIEEIRASKFDLLVLDYSSNGEASGEFTRNDVTALKGGSGGSKAIIAYLSIGKALFLAHQIVIWIRSLMQALMVCT